MKYIKSINENWNIDKNLKIPGIPNKFPNYSESHDLILKIFKTFKIEVRTSYNIDFNEDEEWVVYCNYIFHDKEGNIIKLHLMNTDDVDECEFYIKEDGVRDYSDDQLESPIEFIDYLFECDLVSTMPWMRKINEFRRSVTKQLNEELTEETISKDSNTSHEEKEDLMIKLKIDHINKYKSMKGRFDSMFRDLENDIDVPSLNKLIDDNSFLKEYSQLLYKRRDLDVLKSMITSKEERVKELKSELQDSNLDSESDPETRRGLSDQIRQSESELNDSKSKKSNYKDVPNLLQKWDIQIIKLTRDLKQGKSVLDSTLDDLR